MQLLRATIEMVAVHLRKITPKAKALKTQLKANKQLLKPLLFMLNVDQKMNALKFSVL